MSDGPESSPRRDTTQPRPPDGGGDRLSDAVECFDRGELDRCLELLAALRAERAGEVPGDAWYFESLCHRNRGELARAEVTMRRAVEVRPDEADYLLELGLIVIEQGRTQEGLDVLRDAVHASGHAPEFRHELYLQNAIALYGEGYLEGCVLSLRKALKFARDMDTYRILTQVLIEWGHAEEALEAVGEGLDLFPRHATLHHMAGLALSVARRPYEAAQAFVRAYELDPRDAGPVHSLGLIFETTGDYGRALETFERCLTLSLDDATRADVQQRIGQIKTKLAEMRP